MVGTGYVGLVSGACFADFGHDVVCVDKDSKKVDALKRGEILIFEPGLDDIVRKNCLEGRLSFATSLSEAANRADAIFIAVGTPSRRGDGHADLSYVYSAAREIAEIIDGYAVVVTKSTVPVGTGDEVMKIIRDARPNAEFAFEKVRLSTTSSIPIASSSVLMMPGRGRSCRKSIGRYISIRVRFSSPRAAPRN
jgi:UDPglucose 6-dehydrogenase